MKTSKRDIHSDGFVLSIGGIDPVEGAGVLLDVKVFQYFSIPHLSVISTVVPQNNREVLGVYSLPKVVFEKELKAILGSYKIKLVKISLINSIKHAEIIYDYSPYLKNSIVIYDPIFSPSLGKKKQARDKYKKIVEIIGNIANIITPNFFEAKIISEGEEVIEGIFRRTNVEWILLKGGHKNIEEGTVEDILVSRNGEIYKYNRERLRKDIHGTGCMLSDLLAVHLYLGLSVPSAFMEAESRFDKFIANNIYFPIPSGSANFFLH